MYGEYRKSLTFMAIWASTILVSLNSMHFPSFFFTQKITKLFAPLSDFKMESVETIASHIISLYGSKILAYTDAKNELNIKLAKVDDNEAVYINTSEAGVQSADGRQYEDIIDRKFLNDSNPQRSFRLETYRSSGNVSSTLSQRLRCYFVTLCDFVEPNPDPEETDIRKVSDKRFLERVSENTLEIYQDLMHHAMARSGPVVEAYEVEGSRERRMVIALRQGSTQHFFSALSKLYHWYGLYSTRKYVEQFSNGITIISLYLHPLRGPPIESSIFQIVREVSLIYCLPNNPFFNGGHAAQEAAYAYCGYIFCQHFLNRLGTPYLALKNILNETEPSQAAVLSEIRAKFRSQTFTRQSILEVIMSYPELIRMLYVQFAMVHYISGANQLVYVFLLSRHSSQKLNIIARPTLSYQRLKTDTPLSDDELHR